MTAATIEPWKVAATMEHLAGFGAGRVTELPRAVVIVCPHPKCSKTVAEVYDTPTGFYYSGWITPRGGRAPGEVAAVGEMLTGEHAPDPADLTGECRTGHGVWEVDRGRVITRLDQYRNGSRPHRVAADLVGWRVA